MIIVKRVYDPIDQDDGTRFLVDRLWPRGFKKDVLHIDEWLKDIAPSKELRQWFGHDPEKWDEFRKLYFTELDNKKESVQHLIESSSKGNVTLLYSAKDAMHNNAMALKEYVERQVKGEG